MKRGHIMPNSSNKKVLVNQDIYSTLKSDTVSLKIGSMTTVSNIGVLSKEQNKDLIKIDLKTAKKLLVPNNSYLPYYIEKDILRLGPSVGILTSSKKQNISIPKGKKGRLLKEMINYGQKKGVFIFFFYADGVNWKRKTVKGYSTDNNGKWITGNYGMPSIVYNRIQYRSIESKSNVKTLLQNLNADPEIFVFNSRFLNKWEVSEVLWGFETGQKFSPETKKFNRKNLRDMLGKHPELFLKPINNSRGQGIIKIISNRNNSFRYSKANTSSPKWQSSSSFYNLSEALSRMGVKENRYLIQQGIDLARFNDKVFDLRTQVQKDATGKWIITGVAARVAGKGRFVTHIPNGGSAHSIEEVLKEVFGTLSATRDFIDRQLKTICSVIPPKLEEGLGINLAILSLDIGIDSAGNLWILEINSKPASFDEDDIRHKHLNYLIDYFIFSARKIAMRNDF